MKTYNRVTDLLFWERKQKNCNCGSFALNVDAWFLPLGSGEVYGEREDKIRELYYCGCNREDILEIFLEKDVECILALCPWIEPIDREEIRPEDTVVAYRLALELEETEDAIDGEMYIDYLDEDFHFRARFDGVWYEKCGSTEIEICDEQDEDIEEPWNTGYGMVYDSPIRYFRYKNKT